MIHSRTRLWVLSGFGGNLKSAPPYRSLTVAARNRHSESACRIYSTLPSRDRQEAVRSAELPPKPLSTPHLSTAPSGCCPVLYSVGNHTHSQGGMDARNSHDDAGWSCA